MKNMLVLTIWSMLVLFGCSQPEQKPYTKAAEHPNITKLKKHSEEFRPEIVQLGEHLHVAVGYDPSNASMIIGEDGVIIVDALISVGAAKKVSEEFRKITDKPVKALIYTHGHGDHTGGTSEFIKGYENVQIIARAGFKEELQGKSPVQPILMKRYNRQFGKKLPPEKIINRGVSSNRKAGEGIGKGYIKPNVIFQDSLITTIAGIDIQLFAANGETNDQLFAWCPNEKILFSGDNYYKAFPNLYAIRGSRYRDVKSWGDAVHKMSTYPVEYLVPGHTRPLSGTALINRRLSKYSEAILSVYEQTIDAMNQGYSLEQTVARVKLPESLINEPDLQEFYGSVAWGVRSIFMHYVGWFDGNPANLNPLPPKVEAANMVALAGGESNLYKQLQQSVEVGRYQWALQLTDYLVATGFKKNEVLVLKVKTLEELAAQQMNAPARNYYLSCAHELKSDSLTSLSKQLK